MKNIVPIILKLADPAVANFASVCCFVIFLWTIVE
jgi:hypothetical protein